MIIDICINSPGHIISKIDGIHGSKNLYFRQKVCMVGTREYNNKSTRINAASMICDKKKGLKSFFSEDCIKLCSSENGQTDVKVGVKHKKRQDIYQNQ